jgi:hypothetical protein
MLVFIEQAARNVIWKSETEWNCVIPRSKHMHCESEAWLFKVPQNLFGLVLIIMPFIVSVHTGLERSLLFTSDLELDMLHFKGNGGSDVNCT